ncbi:hypothetical protein JVU11DRAFT_5807 [Chiua virens]|nr:hypothetical protein JVU11DRAFT_5807 [Chiua virens]
MLGIALVCLVTTGNIVSALANQEPLRTGGTTPTGPWEEGLLNFDAQTHEWDLNTLPNPNVTDHLVFETMHSLLQRWPNTRIRNGHSIVPAVIPTGTIFYHGTGLNKLPQGPEWLATSPEHAYFFCQDELVEPIGQECRLFTLATTRPLKVVYFDGQSAARVPYGTLDTQDLIILGEPLPETDDWERAGRLCDWGNDFGLDGFVRMGMSFEVILCDFNSAVRVVSSMNLVRPGSVRSGISRSFVSFETIHAGSWQNHFPGEVRVHLDLARLVSFYDTQLAPSLIAVRAGQERWDHRAGNISSDDFSALKLRLEKNLVPSGQSSGIDWVALMHVIVDRFADRFELIRHFLSSPSTNPDEVIDVANKTQTQLRIMLNPYLYLSAVPTDPSNKAALNWTVPIFKLCTMTYTSFTDSELNLMTESEKLIHQAIRGVSRETCRIVTKMWAAGVYAGIDDKLNRKGLLDMAEITDLRNTWAEDLSQLMAWLDWNVWVKCNPGCHPEEICYLPTYPVSQIAHRPDNSRERVKPEPEEWIRPQPKCVRRVYPYSL